MFQSNVDQDKWPGHAKFFGALWDGDGPTCAAHHGTTGAAGDLGGDEVFHRELSLFFPIQYGVLNFPLS